MGLAFPFEDGAGHFAEEEWAPLEVEQRDLYWDVMQENYEQVASLGKNLALMMPCWPAREIKEELVEPEISDQVDHPGSASLAQETQRGPRRPWELQAGWIWREPSRHLRAAGSKHSLFHVGRKKLTCPECDRWFHCKSEFLLHWRTHTGEKPFECLACGKCFIQSSHLSAHRRIHTGEKPYECPKCRRSFNRRSTMTEHLRIHTGEKPYKCLQCGESFRWRPYLTKHRRTHLGNPAYRGLSSREIIIKGLSLPEWSESHAAGGAVEDGTPETHSQPAASRFPKLHRGAEPALDITRVRQGLNAPPLRQPVKTEAEPLPERNDITDIPQIKIVPVGKKHMCHECGKAFQYKFELVKHHRTHTGEKPYECLACGKRFFQSTHLNAHRRIHTGEKPYECPKCGRSFNRRSTMTEHLRIHTGEKPYKCLQCGESFRWRPYLTKHRRAHLGESTYRYFNRESLYKRSSFPEHLEVNQPDLTPTPNLNSCGDPQERWMPPHQGSEETPPQRSNVKSRKRVKPSRIPSEVGRDLPLGPAPPPSRIGTSRARSLT